MSAPQTNIPMKTCPSKRVHDGHRWWSRQHKRYFICGGKKR